MLMILWIARKPQAIFTIRQNNDEDMPESFVRLIVCNPSSVGRKRGAEPAQEIVRHVLSSPCLSMRPSRKFQCPRLSLIRMQSFAHPETMMVLFHSLDCPLTISDSFAPGSQEGDTLSVWGGVLVSLTTFLPLVSIK